jgi:xylulokinase
VTLVAGIDSSTQSCKVVVVDADTGRLVREGRATHPDATEVDPSAWWAALEEATEQAGGLADVDAVAVGGQQHGMVALDAGGQVVRKALLWNDTRSAPDAADLVAEGGGPEAWARDTGSVPVASYTVTKLRWMARVEPANAERTAAVALPHDWLTWQLRGGHGLDALATDRSDASGTGYWSPAGGTYQTELLELALGHQATVPTVAGPKDRIGEVSLPDWGSAVIGPGAGDNAAAALGLGLTAGDVAISVGTSGVVSAISDTAAADASGLVSGFADATGRFLPLACTLNAARVLDAACRILGVEHHRLGELAMAAPPGADGLVWIPYLEGERTPNKPNATGALHGMTLANTTPGHLARAAYEGVLCSLADGLDYVRAAGATVERLMLIGGAARSSTLQRLAPSVFGLDVVVPQPGEYVAVGAARQAAWVLSGADQPPQWLPDNEPVLHEISTTDDTTHIREQYAAARDHVLDRQR